MNTWDAAALARQLMNQHGLTDWTFQWDGAFNRMGQCRYRTKTISMSHRLCKVNEEKTIRDTILHEIAHALVGPGHDHNYVWKLKAMQIGARPERCVSESNGVAKKYLAECSCGLKFSKSRLRLDIWGTRYYQCPKCRSRLNFRQNYERKVVQNGQFVQR